MGEVLKEGANFIPEKSNMLFGHGRVAEQTNNTTYSRVLFDVSAFTYENIVANLSSLNSTFDEATMLPHGGQITYPEKIEILVSWLSVNWPGCENLENRKSLIAESLRDPKSSEQSKLRLKKTLPRQTNAEGPTLSEFSKRWWLAVTAGIVVLVGLVTWMKCKSRA